MKKALLILVAVLSVGAITGAQVLQNFNANIVGVEKSGDSGKGLDSVYKAVDPSNSANGVLAMHFTFGTPNDTVANLHGRMELGSGGNATYVVPAGAQNITFWVYLDSTQHVPDSLQIDVYGMDNTNWDWTENSNDFQKKLNVHYAKDIPKSVWYPLTFRMSELAAVDKNFAYNAPALGKGFMTGLQLTPHNTPWDGVIYVDNIALYGALQHNLQTFNTDIVGVEKSGDSGKGLDSLYKAADPSNSSNGVMAMHITFGTPNDTVANLHARMELGSGGNATYVVPGPANFLVTWIYLDSTQHVPDSLQIDTYGMDNTNWDWTENSNAFQNKLNVHYAKDIPKSVWYPLTFPMAELAAVDKNFAYNAPALGKGFMTGLQLTPHNTPWDGVIYVDNITLLDTVTAAPPPVWNAADFESGKTQSFFVPSFGATGVLTVVPDLSTSNGTEVLQAAINLANAPRKFAVARDSVPVQSVNHDSSATAVALDVYLPNKMPNGLIVTFYLSAGSTDSVAVVDTVGKQVKANSWNTISTPKLDSLKTAGKFDPSKKMRVGVVIASPQDTSTWKGNVWFDNLEITGINYPAQLPTGVRQLSSVVRSYALYNNYPNPFNPTTMIRYDLAQDSKVLVQVFDIIGREVATLVNERQQAGSYAVPFNATRLASGVYFYRLSAGSFVKTQKMMLLK